MIDVTTAANANEKLALQLIRAMETGDLLATIHAICADDFLWTNSGLEPIAGVEALFRHMGEGGFSSQIPILKTMTHFSADLIHIASNGGIVFTERIDHHWDEAGRDLMTPHICGVTEIRDGKICAFRDFYDVACYRQLPTGIQPGFDLQGFRQAQALGRR